MRTIVHLSDLHFGRIRPDLLEPLLDVVNSLAADLVVISGDLTQRARVEQFRQTRAFLDRVQAPCLVVPGNHDVPLDNVAIRLLGPYRRYRRWISANLAPQFHDEELAVVGINTVNPMVWQRGRIARREVARVCAAIAGGDDRRTRVAVAHHPFAQASEERKALMRGAGAAIRVLASCGLDIVLSGHLHAWRAEPAGADSTRLRSLLLVQAGTGLSTRLRGEENDFNVLRVRPGEVVVERFVAIHPESRFGRAGSATFRRGPSGWRQQAPGSAILPSQIHG